MRAVLMQSVIYHDFGIMLERDGISAARLALSRLCMPARPHAKCKFICSGMKKNWPG